MTSPANRRAKAVFAASVAITLILYIIPFGDLIGYPLVLLSTLVHELGHGITAVLVGGDFEQLKIWADASGVAAHSGRYSPVAEAAIAAGGLVGPAFGAAIGLACARRPRSARVFLFVLGLALAVACLLVVRNVFGLVFVGAVAAASLLIAAKAKAELAQPVLMFLSVQLALAVFSRGDYLFTDVATTGAGTGPSDVAHMAEALGGPYWLWGAVCGLISIAVLAVAAFSLWRKR